MSRTLLAFLGGLLTIVSPCILPIVPLVFSQANRPRRERILMLTGLAATFTMVAAATSAGLGWIDQANELGRWTALFFLTLVALSMLSPRFAELATRPFVRVGQRLDAVARRGGPTAGPVLAGSAIGLLWAPCAGPILGLVIVGGAITGTSWSIVWLLFVFSLGASAALAVVMAAGGHLTLFLRRSLGMERWIRKGLGTAALLGVAAIALGWDRTLLAKGTFAQTAAAEDLLIERLAPRPVRKLDIGESLDAFAAENAATLVDEGAMPEFALGHEWINSPPITRASLKGKVVLVDFWTFECINCLHALPYVKQLYAKYKDQGFIVIGVHTPELPRERIPANVRTAVKELGVTYPVVIDGDYSIWKSWENAYWPAAYFVDATGRVRFHNFGEGRYDEQDAVVRKLLAEAKAANR